MNLKKMRLKELRKQNNKSQEEVAKFLDSKQSNYSKYELEIVEPNISTLKKLADYYNVSIDYLVGRDSPNDLGLITKEQLDLFKMVKLLNIQNFFKLQGYVLRLLEEQGA